MWFHLQRQSHQLRDKRSILEASNLGTLKDGARAVQMQNEIQALQRQTQLAHDERQLIQVERANCVHCCSKLENDSNRVLEELASLSSKSNAVESQLCDSIERLKSVTAEFLWRQRCEYCGHHLGGS